jgi:hypothetical protein
LYREEPCATAAGAADVTAWSYAGEASPPPAAAAAWGCCKAPDSVVAVDAPVEREEAEEVEEEPSAAVGHMLSIPMMSCYTFDAPLVSLVAFLALVSWRVLCTPSSVPPLQLQAASASSVVVIASLLVLVRNSEELLIRLYCTCVIGFC